MFYKKSLPKRLFCSRCRRALSSRGLVFVFDYGFYCRKCYFVVSVKDFVKK